MEQITFSALQLIIDGKEPLMPLLKNSSNKPYQYDKAIYKISCEKIDSRFFWIYAEYGRELPYSSKVVNKSRLDTTVKNPRKKEEIELSQQVFATYDNTSKNFYVSNTKKITFLKNFLSEELSKSVEIKKYIIPPEKFVEKIKSIGKIKLTSKRNLFSQKSGLFENVTDVFGLGQPEDFTVDINYKGQNKTDKFIHFLNTFIENKSNKEIDSLVCIGTDEQNMELIFNIDSFTKKVSFHSSKNDNGLYDIEGVKNNIINKLKKGSLKDVF